MALSAEVFSDDAIGSSVNTRFFQAAATTASLSGLVVIRPISELASFWASSGFSFT